MNLLLCLESVGKKDTQNNTQEDINWGIGLNCHKQLNVLELHSDIVIKLYFNFILAWLWSISAENDTAHIFEIYIFSFFSNCHAY